MNRRELLKTLGAGAIGFGINGIPSARLLRADAKPKRILMFTKSSGYEHAMIKRTDGKLGPAEQILTDLGKQNAFDVLASKDGRIFSSADLPQFDAFFFYTTGDLTTEGTDKNPPMTAEGKQRFLDLIHDGKGFIGTHSAADTFHSPGDRFDPKPQTLDPYVEMLGAEFIAHDAQQTAHLIVADKKFPGLAPLGDALDMNEEWYPFRSYQPDLHVLTILETKGMNGPHYQRPAYPNTWARMHGRGRVFYTALGHRDDVWASASFQSLLLGGINWSLKNVDAGIAPNLAEVAPHASDIPAAAFAHPAG
jgi:type 1 glutamine amidotransferase